MSIRLLFSLFAVLVGVVIGQTPTPPKAWPATWYTWVVTTVTQVGVDKPLYDVGQLIAYDTTKQWTCRTNQQNLLNPNPNRPVDFCDFQSGQHHMLNNVLVGSTCAGEAETEGRRILPIQYPEEYIAAARFFGVDKVAQKECNHFVAMNLLINGFNIQMDVWTDVDTGYPCQISINDLVTKQITTWAFDGFATLIPQAAIDQCNAAKILCTQNDWVCNAYPTTSPSNLQNALSWVCTPDILDCSPINPGGSHYYPNTLLDHCNWAFNAYFLKNRNTQGYSACSFGGIAHLIPPSPSPFIESPSSLANTTFPWIPNNITCARSS